MPHMAPTLADIERLAREAAAGLPEPFRKFLADIAFVVTDFPDAEVMAEMGLESPFDILGLYQGHPVGSEGEAASLRMPPVIHLYRRPILDEWSHGEDSLEHLIQHLIVHEVGHHFGLSDDDMEAIEAGWR
jgi:predicted Zn-dependent protease with MMP-like domain